MSGESRTPRANTKRDARRRWQQPSVLPEPDPQEGIRFRWVRLSDGERMDDTNYSASLREGWEPVKPGEVPEMKLQPSRLSEYKDNVTVGGMILCKMPVEMVEERTAYYAEVTGNQMAAIDNEMMRSSDARMPIQKTQRRSVAIFGREPTNG